MIESIVEAFSEDLFALFPEATQCYGRPFIAHPDPIYGIKTLRGYIFDDAFWDVFHSYPFRICHIAWLADEEVYEIRFKTVDEVMDEYRRTEGDGS